MKVFHTLVFYIPHLVVLPSEILRSLNLFFIFLLLAGCLFSSVFDIFILKSICLILIWRRIRRAKLGCSAEINVLFLSVNGLGPLPRGTTLFEVPDDAGISGLVLSPCSDSKSYSPLTNADWAFPSLIYFPYCSLLLALVSVSYTFFPFGLVCLLPLEIPFLFLVSPALH